MRSTTPGASPNRGSASGSVSNACSSPVKDSLRSSASRAASPTSTACGSTSSGLPAEQRADLLDTVTGVFGVGVGADLVGPPLRARRTADDRLELAVEALLLE